MHARDASGRQVSLLNDEPARQPVFSPVTYSSPNAAGIKRTNSYVSAVSSSPRTPDLLRADSYDSQMSAFCPLTPTSLYEYGRQSSYTTYPDPSQFDQHQAIYGAYSEKLQNNESVRPSYVPRNSSSYDEDIVSGNLSDRQASGKRYPCRYRDSHNCDKTFTTSGHASRHSKIHTAEKAVNCSFPGCQKKFTRADNMKQHLETHYKERSRTSQKISPAGSKLSMSAGVRKRSSTPQAHRPASRNATRDSYSHDSYPSLSSPAATSPLASPVSPHCMLDMNGFQQALPLPRVAVPRLSTHRRTDSATFRLDALASIASDSI